MYFPWNKWVELPLARRNTLQIFITNRCNMSCAGCFARNIEPRQADIDLEEYDSAIGDFLDKGGQQVNLLGGEPLLHPKVAYLLSMNKAYGLKTTIYTNGSLLSKYTRKDLDTKLRVSIYSSGNVPKGARDIPKTDIPFEANYMVSSTTTLEDILRVAELVEHRSDCKTFFISSIRELDNPDKDFFTDTSNTMPVLKYKELVHSFLKDYDGNMDIHISKRGVFESTVTLPDNKCRFANYFIGGKIIQCPYDVVNLKYQKDYTFGERYCQQSSSCLMSKIIIRRK